MLMSFLVRTGSRLHFGLLSLAPLGSSWPDGEGQPRLAARRYGGVGLMVEDPGVCVMATPAREWSAEGPLSDRALDFARHVEQALTQQRGAGPGCLHIRIEAAAPEHVGLGTGTQLGLAVARAAAAAWGIEADLACLARWSGRGGRSAIGTHGFEQGGLLVDGGKRAVDELAPLAARIEFPPSWRVVLTFPTLRSPGALGLYGSEEGAAFAQLAVDDPHRTEALCRLVLLGLLPAARQADLEAFGEALYDFNRRSGEAFAALQGGAHAYGAVADLVAFWRHQGVRGVGQSSWGPAVFAVVADAAEAHHRARSLRRQGPGPVDVLITAARNQGASIEEGGELPALPARTGQSPTP